MRLTKKEREAIHTVVNEGIGQSEYHLLEVLNCDGWEKPNGASEDYTPEELDRIIRWLWKKLGLEA